MPLSTIRNGKCNLNEISPYNERIECYHRSVREEAERGSFQTKGVNKCGNLTLTEAGVYHFDSIALFENE